METFKSPERARFILSIPYVEKVVRAPRKPVIKNKRKEGEIKSFSAPKVKTIPIRKHPRRLTINVPTGNREEKNLTERSVIP